MDYTSATNTESTPLDQGVQVLSNLRSAPLDQRLHSNATTVRSLVMGLVAEVAALENRPMRIEAHKAARRFFECLVVNFFDAWVTDPACHVAVKLGKHDYDGSEFKYKAVCKGMAGLEALGYVYKAGHLWNPVTQKGLVTRFKATDKLIGMFAPLDLSIVQIRERSPLVEIRPTGKARRFAAKRKEKILERLPWPAKDRGLKAKRIKNVRILNAALREQFQGLCLPDKQLRTALGRNKRPVNLRRQQLHRTFLIDPYHGGRFVGPWWQAIKKELREHIRIASPGKAPEETIEIDFDSLHPAMLYATKRMPAKQDLYGIYESSDLNKTIRPVIKALTLTLINSESPRDAANSYIETFNTEIYPDWLLEEYDQKEPVVPFAKIDTQLKEIYPGCPPVAQLITDIVKFHAPIADCLGTGAGRWLMFGDSEISEMIMLTMLRQHGIVPLPNHDSFIVPKQYSDFLKATMETTFAARFPGITPRVTAKPVTGQVHVLDESHLYSKLLRQWNGARR